MKLEPIAKPIRIRIKIGKEEFSDFYSLKENLSLKELYPLFKDGRLERWFNQIGKDELARKTGEAAKKFEEESVSDYLLLLSLFSDEISSIMAQSAINFNINEFCKETTLQNIEMVYGYTKDIKVFEWGKIAEGIISKENIKDFFENELLHEIYSNAEWSKRFANFVNNVYDYKRVFTEIEEKSRVNHNYGQLIEEFYKTTRDKRPDWVKVYEKELTVEYLLYLYKNPYLNELDIDWGRIFADSLSSWNKDSERIYKALKVNPKHVKAFNERCAEKGINEAKDKLDPWYKLANSDDFKNIYKALAEWDGNNRHYYKENYGYSKIKNELGKQILNFLQYLIVLDKSTYFSKYNLSLLACEKEIMLMVKKDRYYKFGSLTFRTTSSDKLKAFCNENKNKLAEYVLIHNQNSYLEIAKEAVNIIRRRLLEKRKI